MLVSALLHYSEDYMCLICDKYPAHIYLCYNPVDVYMRYYPADICPGSNLLCSSVAQVGQSHNLSEVLSLTYLDNHFHSLYQSANIRYFRHIAQKVLLIKTRYDICPTFDCAGIIEVKYY